MSESPAKNSVTRILIEEFTRQDGVKVLKFTHGEEQYMIEARHIADLMNGNRHWSYALKLKESAGWKGS
jgi:hypothetical protein